MPGLMRRLAEGADPHGCHPVFGEIRDYLSRPALVDGKLVWQPVGEARISVLSPLAASSRPPAAKLLAGSLGRAVVKVSAVAPEYRVIEPRPGLLLPACGGGGLQAGGLNQDAVIVVRHNGPPPTACRSCMLMPVPATCRRRVTRWPWSPTVPPLRRLRQDPGRHPRHPGSAARRGHRPARRWRPAAVDAESGRLDCLTDLRRPYPGRDRPHPGTRGVGP